MEAILIILLVVAAVKFVFFGFVLYHVFRKDIREYQQEQRSVLRSTPACMYCGSVWTEREDEGRTQWDNDELVLVTGYTCTHCRLPFWHVERVPVGSAKS